MSSVLDRLSPREREVMEELSQYGQSNQQIADNLGCSDSSIKTHLGNAFTKIGALNRTHAVIIYLQLKAERKWIQDHGPDELYNKFRIWSHRQQRWINEDGSEFIMVLRPETDRHASGALDYYARSSQIEYPKRAEKIYEKLQEIRERNGA